MMEEWIDSAEPLERVEALGDESASVEYVVAAPWFEPIEGVESSLASKAERVGSDSPAPPEWVDLTPIFEALGAFARRLDGGLAEVRALVDRDRRAEESREKVVDRLHAELQDYKNDLLLKLLRPIFLDLIQLHDDLGKRAEVLGEGATSALLRDYQQGIEDILYRQGVEPFEASDEWFDAKRQRVVSTVPTDEVELNKRIAARIRRGFTSGEKVIRPELVSVYAARRG